MRAALTLLLAGCALVSPAVAHAQTRSADSRWEIGVHGGLSFLRFTGDGELTLPDPGPGITTSSPVFPSRQVSSWFFGDGAALLNEVNAQFGLAERVTPLDSAISAIGLGNASRTGFGLSLARSITPRLSIEFDFDVMPAANRLADSLSDAAQATRQSFTNAFEAMFASGPFTGAHVATVGRTNPGLIREVAATWAVVYRFSPRGSWVPYATAGGGVTSGMGSAGSVTLQGIYQATVIGSPAIVINESDNVTLRYDLATSAVGVAGGGVRKDVHGTWTLRVDGRVLMGRPGTRVLLDAAPSVQKGTPAGFIESFTYPSIQFSNDPATGRLSTLSGQRLENAVAFSADGLRARVLVTAGLIKRF